MAMWRRAAAAILHAIGARRARPLPGRPLLGRARPSQTAGKIGQEPLLDLGMRLGEASGAALAAGIVKAAADLHNGMATFESAGVSTSEA